MHGDYRPLTAVGTKQQHICAFARSYTPPGGTPTEIIIVVPRLVVGLTEGVEQMPLGAKVWKDTLLVLPDANSGQTYVNVFTGEQVSASAQEDSIGLAMSEVCAHFPIALLTRAGN
jgi:maltooligosyltrehalose synthase